VLIARAVLLFALSLALAAGTTAAAVRPPTLILFDVPHANGFGVVRPDGQDRRILSDTYTAGEWSPDGRRIAAHGPGGLSVLDDQGRLVRTLVAPPETVEAKWSPNGRWLTTLRQRCAPRPDAALCYDLWLVRADGSGTRRLVSARVLQVGTGSLHEWSPDGRTISYTGSIASAPAGSTRRWGIVLVSLTGRTVTRKAFRLAWGPTWAPDGGRLAFTRNQAIFVARRDGSHLRRLTWPSGLFQQPKWSPDGRRIAMLQTIRGGFSILVMDLHLHRARVGGVASPVELLWSPDSTRLAWTGVDGGEEKVFVAPADGTLAPEAITTGIAADWR
jgi:Tol biopolymer transport system component